MDLIVPHDRADMPADHDSSPLHRTTFCRQPRKFIDQRIIDFVIFDACVVSLVLSTIPIDKDSQLHIVNFIFSDYDMGGVEGTHATAICSRAIEPHFESFDPKPITAI